METRWRRTWGYLLLWKHQTKTDCWTIIKKKDWNPPKNTYIFCTKRQRRRQNKRVGGVYLQHDQIPFLAGGWCTKWKIIILQSCSKRIERTEALVRLQTWASGIGSRAFSFKAQWGLILGMPQGWGKQWLHFWRAHTVSGRGTQGKSSDFIGTWSDLPAGLRGSPEEGGVCYGSLWRQGSWQNYQRVLIVMNSLGNSFWYQDLALPNSL